MPATDTQPSRSSGAAVSRAAEDANRLDRVVRTLEAAQKDLAAIGGSVGVGVRDLRRDVARLLRDARRDLLKMQRAIQRDLERLQRNVTKAATERAPAPRAKQPSATRATATRATASRAGASRAGARRSPAASR